MRPIAPGQAAPLWFVDAVAQVPESGSVEVLGAQIAWRAWGDTRLPGVVLVHGAGGNSRWWDHIGPLLASDHRVVALDLSGHGDSAWRDEYGLDVWAQEIRGAWRVAGGSGPWTVVGHSMGGFPALKVGTRAESSLKAVVCVDSAVRDVPDPAIQRRHAVAAKPRSRYASAAEATSRFRLVPSQPALAYVTDHIAAHSVRERDGTWGWKFDSRIFTRESQSLALLEGLTVPVAFLNGEFGLVGPEIDAQVRERVPPGTPMVRIPQAGHHCMLDQPIALVTALRCLVAVQGTGRRVG
ncbi:alpha/beta hydrolase [Nocardioides sp. WS12]|uniref:alpha/beta fold hydrolase n=1 Tax=Nocardioides sp. WS12 TaxID=2486272 RepID=UPI0015FD52E5|nr:alpha/beta hydrolase [Nocardioides sp. WS12]